MQHETTKRFSPATLCLSILLAIAAPAMGQEESVRPGINDNFKAPDPDSFVRIFEAESREIYAHREEIIAALDLKTGMDVADVGAGTGFFSRLIAQEVAPSGTVYAVDIAERFLDHIRARAREESIENIKTVLCDEKSTRLSAESVDLIFITDTYHHFEYPYHTLQSVHQALRPNGILVIVDFERVKGITSGWAYSHVRSGKGTVSDEVKDAGFDFVEEVPMMKEQYFLKFKKREE